MKNKSNFFHKFVTLLVVLSLSGQSVVFAQAPLQQDKLRIGYNDATGKVSFIGADPSRPIAIRSAQVQGITADSSARAMISPYAADFGLKNPSSELKLISTDQVEGRAVTRFQQVYKDIPIMGGEMIVNATDQAELLSLSAEISPDLVLDTNSSISPKQAQITAVESMAKSHQVLMDALETTEPELWIYDLRLLEPDGTPATLVWRLEVKSRDNSLPINELVLVDAKRGAIVLNFNQIDTTWVTGTARAGFNPTTLKQDGPPTDITTVTPTSEETVTPVPENTEIPTVTPTPDVTETPAAENTEIPTPTPESQKLIGPRTAGAATIYYVNIATGNDSNSCTTVAAPCKHIQETINKASSGDTIKVATGTYTGTGTEVVLINKSIVLSGGWNAAFITQSGTSTIDGQSLRRGVNIPYNYPDLIITTTMERFTVQNGFTSSIGGGGIYNSHGSLTLNDSIVSGNTSQGSGGGIFNFGTLTINNTTISGNSTGVTGYSGGGGGGGIENYSGSITLNNSLIARNFILGSFSGSGIDTSGTLILNNSTVSENTGGDGAGISAGSGATVLFRLT